MLGCGVLVVKDPPGGVCAEVPEVMGINSLSRCYQELFDQHGTSLFDLPVAAKAPNFVFQALPHCHQVDTKPVSNSGG